MRRVIVQEFVSADGFAGDASGNVDFVPGSMQGDRSFGDRQHSFIDSVDTMLLGRVTYEMFAAHWPNANEGDDKEFSEKLNRLHKVVFSRTLDRAPWGTFEAGRIVKADPVAEVRSMKDAAGKDMVIWGSLSIAQVLRDVVDEYQLIVCPLVFGEGKSIFRPIDAQQLELVDTRSFDRGAVLLSYRPRR